MRSRGWAATSSRFCLNGLTEEEQANAIAFRIQEALEHAVFDRWTRGIHVGQHRHRVRPRAVQQPRRDHARRRQRDVSRESQRQSAPRTVRRRHARARRSTGSASKATSGTPSKTRISSCTTSRSCCSASGMCVGFESLIRWSRKGEPISPATFIPMAEELGLIEPVGTWVLEQACSDVRRLEAPVSAQQPRVHHRQRVEPAARPAELPVVRRSGVHDAGLRPCDLRLEITETALMDSPTTAAGLLRELREFGVKIYLDDFGTGYSSLSHLHRLPVDALKIDRSFVKSLRAAGPAGDRRKHSRARANDEHERRRRRYRDRRAGPRAQRLGCTHAQGFLFSRPIPAVAAEKLIAANQPLSPHKGRAVLEFEPKVAIPA